MNNGGGGKKILADLLKLLNYRKIKNTAIGLTSTCSKKSGKQARVAKKHTGNQVSYLELLPNLLCSINQPVPLIAWFLLWLLLQRGPQSAPPVLALPIK